MDDLKALTKELHRIADSGERIAKALEKQNKVINLNPEIHLDTENNVEKVKGWVADAIRDFVESAKEA